MLLLNLFWSFFKVGAFSFGGGYAMIPLIEREIIRTHQWLTLPEFIDVIAISQATPGPVAINSATFVGYKIAGFWGSAVATLGVVLPSLFIILALAWLFIRYRNLTAIQNTFAGIRPAVVALIIMAALSVFKSSVVDVKSAVLAASCLLALLFTSIDPILLMVIAGVLGIILY